MASNSLKLDLENLRGTGSLLAEHFKASCMHNWFLGPLSRQLIWTRQATLAFSRGTHSQRFPAIASTKKDSSARTVSLCASLAFLMLAAASQPSSAAQVLINGVFFGVTAPFSPSTSQQCEDFAAELNKTRKWLGERHDKCLDANKGSGTNRAKNASCSIAACEGMHIARDDFSNTASREASACFSQVSAARKSMEKSMSTPEGMDKVQAALTGGLWGSAMSKVRKQITAAFEQYLPKDTARTAANGTLTAANIMPHLLEARNACIRQVPGAAAIECEKQVMLSVTSVTRTAQVSQRTDPIIAKIQAIMLEQLAAQNRSTLRELNVAFRNDPVSVQESQESGGSLGR